MTATATRTKKAPRRTARALAPKKEGQGRRAADAAAQLASATVVLELERRKPGFQRKLDSKQVMREDDAADPSALHISKDLLDRRLLAAIGSEDGAVRRWLEGRAVRCGMLARGMWLIPLALVKDVDQYIADYKQRREQLVAKLVDEEYEKGKEEAKKRLGTHYNEADYPPAAELKAAFTVRQRYLGFNVPGALQGLSDELYQREMARVQAECVVATQEISEGLREGLAQLVENLSEALQPGEDGKPRVFRDTTVEKLQEFLDLFAARNITGDAQLAQLAQAAKQVVKGVKPAALRKDQDARQRVVQGLAKVQAQLGSQVVTRARQVARRDEEV